MAQLFVNNARTTLAAAVASGDTAITLADGSAFPSPTGSDYALITLAKGTPENTWEIVKCTNRMGDILGVARAQEGTSALSWSIGDTVELRWTKTAADRVGTGLTEFPMETIDATDSTSTTTGSIKTAGGIGIQKTAYFGNRINLAQVAPTGTAGDLWTDSAQKALGYNEAGLKMFVPGLMYNGAADGPDIGSTTTYLTIVPTTGVGSLTTPANFFRLGRKLRIKAFCIMTGTAYPINFALFSGGTNIGDCKVTPDMASTNGRLDVEFIYTCRAVTGVNAAWNVVATIRGKATVAATTSFQGLESFTGTAMDTSIARALDLRASWTGTGGTALICKSFSVEVLG